MMLSLIRSLLALVLLLDPVLSAPTREEKRADGFVGVEGTHFTMNGNPFYFTGTNAYYLAQYSDNDIKQAFADMKDQGISVVRTWAFNDVTEPQNYGAYYQLWTDGTATLNEGPYGLDRLDSVVQAAGDAGVKLILSLTNNWSDYGGMDVYVSQLNNGGTHDTFYTDSDVLAAFQNYVSEIVGRYKDEASVMAWELANEPRCAGSTTQASSACNTTTITTWVSSISSYIKSLDSQHLVAVGDEGFMGWQNSTEYVYTGGAGISFPDNLAISSIDFGTFHMYPDSWGTNGQDPSTWGNAWIQAHADVQGDVGKPTIIEEFGKTGDEPTKLPIYTEWYNTIEAVNLAGSAYWQFGDYLKEGGTTYDDGYAIYPDQTTLVDLIKKDAAAQAAKN